VRFLSRYAYPKRGAISRQNRLVYQPGYFELRSDRKSIFWIKYSQSPNTGRYNSGHDHIFFCSIDVLLTPGPDSVLTFRVGKECYEPVKMPVNCGVRPNPYFEHERLP
jgi:hypothetical protein